MKTATRSRKKSAKVNNSRWAAYATAGFATALADTHSAEGAIHYSGPINESFNAPPGSYQFEYFVLDKADGFALIHRRSDGGTNGQAQFKIFGEVSGAFNGLSSDGYVYVSKLAFGANISGGPFAAASFGSMAYGNGYPNSQWLQPGTGFVGFKFNHGAGVEYGWARVTMDSGTPGNTFTLVDYAWGDVGDQVTAGQIPEPGSLALLALGGMGLVAWRKRRAQTHKI